MRFGMGVPKPYMISRSERRVPMEVGVQIFGNGSTPGRETTFTENVSSRGARVLSSRRWNINDHLMLMTMTGSFRSLARVAYCEMVPEAGFAVGLEFLEPSGDWVIRGGAAN
ncbi:MAG TPA: PilZ domain-containing protein [Candidatus Acidoferrum sp.]|nr:PilZ domain-containing protein [Candidatus Acidoferrum sp.]